MSATTSYEEPLRRTRSIEPSSEAPVPSLRRGARRGCGRPSADQSGRLVGGSIVGREAGEDQCRRGHEPDAPLAHRVREAFAARFRPTEGRNVGRRGDRRLRDAVGRERRRKRRVRAASSASAGAPTRVEDADRPLPASRSRGRRRRSRSSCWRPTSPTGKVPERQQSDWRAEAGASPAAGLTAHSWPAVRKKGGELYGSEVEDKYSAAVARPRERVDRAASRRVHVIGEELSALPALM